MTWFFYEDGRSEERKASELCFRPVVTLTDADDETVVHTFNRRAWHLPGRLTVIYVEGGTWQGLRFRMRVERALGINLVAPVSPAAPAQWPFVERPEPEPVPG